MKGCARREMRQHGYAMAAGWHAERFRREGKQLRDLGHYLKQLEPNANQSVADEAAAIFKSLEARGQVRIRERRKDT